MDLLTITLSAVLFAYVCMLFTFVAYGIPHLRAALVGLISPWTCAMSCDLCVCLNDLDRVNVVNFVMYLGTI